MRVKLLVAMGKSVRNSIGLRKEAEAHQIGLNGFGSFVLATLDVDELNHLKSVDPDKLKWSSERHVVVARGTPTKGVCVRFVNLALRGRYCRLADAFPKRFCSPRLLRCEPQSISDFLTSIADRPVVEIKKRKTQRNYTGILVGNPEAQYNSLIVIDDGALKSIHMEHEGGAQFAHEITHIVHSSPPGRDKIRAAIFAAGDR